MSNAVGFGQGLELRDASGRTLGVFLPDAVIKELIAERDALRKQVAEQQEKLATLKAERDSYRQTVYALWPKDVPLLTEEELDEMKRNGIPFRQIIEEIELFFSDGEPSGTTSA